MTGQALNCTAGGGASCELRYETFKTVSENFLVYLRPLVTGVFIMNSVQVITRSKQMIARSIRNFVPSLPLERFLDGRGDSERPPGRGRPPPNTLVEGQKPVILQTFDGLIQRTLPLMKENLLTKCYYIRKQRLS